MRHSPNTQKLNALEKENKMEHKKYDSEFNKELFGLDYLSDYPEEEQDRRIDLAAKIIKECGEAETFAAWFDYLKVSVSTVHQAWSFMLWYYNYGGADFKVDDPYPFFAILFKKLGLTFDDLEDGTDQKEMFDTFDSIYASMLVACGMVGWNDYFCINPYRDQRLAEEINAL